MTGMTTFKVLTEYDKGIQNSEDRRRYKRFDLAVLGRFMLPDQQEFPCRLDNISLGGANITTDVRPNNGDRVLVQCEEIGILEATVIRLFDGGFAVSFRITHRRRQKLAAQLTWLINRHELPATDQRRPGHDHIQLEPKPVSIKMPNGDCCEHNVLDVSISGASIQLEMRPEIGSRVVVGRLPAKVVRHHDRGIGVEFMNIHHFEKIQADFG